MSFIQKHLGTALGLLFSVAVIVVLGITYQKGYAAAESKYQALMAEADKAHMEVYAKLEGEYRQQEKDHAEALAAIDKTHTERLKNVQAKNRADLAALRNGALQLHNRFRCSDARGGVSATGSGSGLGDGAGGHGLRGADAEFLVSESDRADAVAVRLQACQEIVRADRKLKKEER